MAENNQRSYRDPPPLRSAQEAAETDDPLAELARLIGQRVPMNKSPRDRRSTTPQVDRDEIERAMRYATSDEMLQRPGDEPNLAAPHDDRYGDHRRFRQEPDFAIERVRDRNYGDADETAYADTAEWDGRSSGQHDEDYQDDYEDERHDDRDDNDDGYGDEHDPDLHTSRRGGFVFVAAVFALAVLGTAGAFGYRAIFGAPAMPALPPIIKAEGGPNKIIPKDASSQDSIARQADTTNTGSGERLVSREERPVDITPPIASTAPRTVSTVPVFPDPPTVGGPGAIVGYRGNPTAGNPAMPVEPPAPAAPVTTATAPNPAPSATQITPSSPAAPMGTTIAPAASGMPAATAPKKIRTVTIHTDSPGASEPVAGPSAGSPPRPGTQPGSSTQGSSAGNAPLSIVPSSTEAPAAPARPRPPPVQPVPLNKPPANETASAVPAAPAATGGSYAVQVSSQRSEADAQSSFRDLQAKYPSVLGGREPIIRRADLGAKGIYFRAMVGPFTSSDQASELCSNLKAAGGSCIVQKN
jgi:hypothetical protein